MKSVLVPVDRSECSPRAVKYLIVAHADNARAQIHLVNVQPQLTGDVRQFVPGSAVRDFQRAKSGEALHRARALLDAAGVHYGSHEEAGIVADRIVRTAEALQCDHIVMGTRGLGELGDLIAGSTAIKVLHLTRLPVVLVK